MSYSSYGTRILAYLLDALFVWVPTFISAVLGLCFVWSIDLWPVAAFFFVVAAIWFIGAPIYNSVIRQGQTGQTIGKKKMSIKLVSLKTGAPIGVGFAIIRWLSWPVFNAFTFGLFSLVDMFFPLFDKKCQRVVDKMLTSVVIISGSSATVTSTPGSATLPPPSNDPYS